MEILPALASSLHVACMYMYGEIKRSGLDHSKYIKVNVRDIGIPLRRSMHERKGHGSV